MKGNLLFDGLSLAARQAIVGSMSALSLPAGDTLISQGDTDATKYYVVERGALDVYVHKEEWGEERKVFTCTAGKGVGELALLYSAPRAASVRVAEACKLWVMEREVYNAVKLAHTKQLAVAKREVVDKVPMLAILAPVSVV
jgi:CRP-like cAMP-binding protein